MDLAPFLSSILSIQYTNHLKYHLPPNVIFSEFGLPIFCSKKDLLRGNFGSRLGSSGPTLQRQQIHSLKLAASLHLKNGGFQGRNLQTSRGLEFRCENVSFREGTFTETNSKQKHLKVGEKNAPKGKGDRIPIPSIFGGKHNTNIKIIRISN